MTKVRKYNLDKIKITKKYIFKNFNNSNVTPKTPNSRILYKEAYNEKMSENKSWMK